LVSALIARVAVAVLILASVAGPILRESPPVVAAAPSFADVQIGEMQDVVSHHRDVFGGLAGDSRTHLVTIYVAPSANPSRLSLALAAVSVVGTPADPKQGAKPKRWSVKYATAGPSLAALDAVAQKVSSAQPWRTNVGDKLVSWGIDPARHVVVIGVETISPSIASDASSAFANLAVLEVVERPRNLDRYLDGQPYWGGVRLTEGYKNCTAGFVAFDPAGGKGMLTAGHCWDMNVTVNQGYRDSGGIHITGPMGKVTRRSWGDNLADAEFLNADIVGTSLYPKVYYGCCLNYNVTDSGTSFIGMTVCFDGAFTLDNCSGIVQAIDQCVYIAPYTSCSQTRAVSTNGTRMCDYGDSGGPTYVPNALGATAYGLIKAGNLAGTNCYYSELLPAMNGLGVALVVP
jgi:hypothetical protein